MFVSMTTWYFLRLIEKQDAAANAEMQWIASQGIRLDNFWAGELDLGLTPYGVQN